MKIYTGDSISVFLVVILLIIIVIAYKTFKDHDEQELFIKENCIKTDLYSKDKHGRIHNVIQCRKEYGIKKENMDMEKTERD